MRFCRPVVDEIVAKVLEAGVDCGTLVLSVPLVSSRWRRICATHVTLAIDLSFATRRYALRTRTNPAGDRAVDEVQ